jgi:hypothetical protein
MEHPFQAAGQQMFRCHLPYRSIIAANAAGSGYGSMLVKIDNRTTNCSGHAEECGITSTEHNHPVILVPNGQPVGESHPGIKYPSLTGTMSGNPAQQPLVPPPKDH